MIICHFVYPAGFLVRQLVFSVIKTQINLNTGIELWTVCLHRMDSREIYRFTTESISWLLGILPTG